MIFERQPKVFVLIRACGQLLGVNIAIRRVRVPPLWIERDYEPRFDSQVYYSARSTFSYLCSSSATKGAVTLGIGNTVTATGE